MIAERHKRDLGEAPERCARKTRKTRKLSSAPSQSHSDTDADFGDSLIEPNTFLIDLPIDADTATEFACRFAEIYDSFVEGKHYSYNYGSLTSDLSGLLPAEEIQLSDQLGTAGNDLRVQPEADESIPALDPTIFDDATLDGICFEENELEAMMIAEESESSSPLTHTPAYTEELRLAPPALDGSVALNADFGAFVDPPFLEIETLPNGPNGLPVFSPISKTSSSAPILWQKRSRQGPDGDKDNASLPAPFFRGMEWEWVVCEQEDDVVFAMKKSKVPLRLCKVPVLVRYSCFDEPVQKPVVVVVNPTRPNDAIFLDVYRADGCVSGQRGTFANQDVQGNNSVVLNADFGVLIDPSFLEIKTLPNGPNSRPVFSPISKPSSSAPILWQKRWRQGLDGSKQWLNYDASLPAPFFRGMEWEWVVCEQEDDVVFAMKKSKVPLRLWKVPVLVRNSCFDEPVQKPVLVVVNPARPDDAIFLDVYPSKFVQ